MRVIRFQLSFSLTGITGWMFSTSCVRLYGPTLKLLLFWMGTLMRLATGFWVAFASDSVSAPVAGGASATRGLAGPTGVSCANAGMTGKKMKESNSSKIRLSISILLCPSLLLASARKQSLGQRLRKAHEVLRNHVNKAAARAVDVRYQKERDGDHERQNKKQAGF